MGSKNPGQSDFLTLKNIAQKSVDNTLIKLKKANDDYNNAKAQLDMLNDYYTEYQQKLTDALTLGIKGNELNNFNAFLFTIEKGILQQQQLLATLKMKQKQIIDKLNECQKKVKVYSNLLEKQQQQYLQQQNRLQQKLTDEFAQQQIARRILNEH
ncbi:flagellar export protein FliJ [uncultured Gilliamella sp.]|uniref:flagellar export protein FliJ n=1 Tax=uncultured Gilliamella sp. TaxID=1193505 RepID=UPI0025F84467|nr:flagellar export protein FliJ [uncultured Gilliamella sp.]